VYLIHTNVVSEARKRNKANSEVARFFNNVRRNEDGIYVSVITVGEMLGH